MWDQFGRKIEYMRISVTDRCNLRCTYCMPEEGIEQIEHDKVLRFDEIHRICKIAAGLGISRIKLTGGEPLVRKDLDVLVRMLKETKGIEQVTLTTNGILLAEQLPALRRAGLDAINISLDTMDPVQYKEITRKDAFVQAIQGIQAAVECSDIHVKVNCVALAGENEEQWVPIAGLAKKYPLDVRFIEMMPIGLGKDCPVKLQEEIQSKLEKVYGNSQKEEIQPDKGKLPRGNGPAVYWSFPGFQGKIGFISAISHKFCQNCNRIRMTAEGYIKPCLQFSQGIDMRALLRGESTDEMIKKELEKVIYEKPRCHVFEQKRKDGSLEERQMSRIGG